MSNFAPGDEVVCVDAVGPTASPLRLNAHYVIAEVCPVSGGVLLRDTPVPDGYEFFRARRFRPVRRDSIEAFKQFAADIGRTQTTPELLSAPQPERTSADAELNPFARVCDNSVGDR